MSALYGVWRQDSTRSVALSLDAMEHALLEWQCDERGVGHGANVGLGCRLLHTTPESHFECLPFTHPAFPHLVLVADAWLDNRDALCDTFGIPQGDRATTCDSELILRAYARWGEACAAKLRGDFAFALWDRRQERWYGARDYLGLRPFFYFHTPRLFCFASDIRAVLACPGVPAQISHALLATYLAGSTYGAEKRLTFYQDVVKLPPAHYLVVTHDTARLTRYWSPDDAPQVRLASPEAYAEQARALLEQAVGNATRTPQRVGSHLSGGLDSTAVAILAARELRARGQTMCGYSWSPAPAAMPVQDPHDERTFVETVSAQEYITPRYLAYTTDDITQIYTRDVTRVPREMALREEQTQQSAQADHTRVLLSGWGGDEVMSFSGRGYLAELAKQGEWRALLRGIDKRIPAKTTAWRKARAYAGVTYRRVFQPLAPDILWQLGIWRGQPQTSYIHPEFHRQQQAQIRALRDPMFREHPGVRVTQSLRLENGHLTRRAESWATHGAARGIVYRYPLLDRVLVEFCLGLPPALYFADGHSRAVLRRATQGILPEPMRATRAKTEPAAIGVVLDTVAAGARVLYEKTRPRFGGHPAAQYVDVAKIERAMAAQNLHPIDSPPLLSALSCFYMTALA